MEGTVPKPNINKNKESSQLHRSGSSNSGIECLKIWGGADVIIIEIKNTINVMSFNHPETIPSPQSMEKLSSRKPVPGSKKSGDHWHRW